MTVATRETCYDVIIAGGGMVGASLALALSKKSQGALSILLVESFPLPSADSAVAGGQQPTYTPSFDARSTALSYGSRRIYESLGIWAQLAEHVTPIETIHVSQRRRFGSVLLDTADLEWPALGYVIENAWLGNSLFAAVASQTNIHCLSPASVVAVTPYAELNQTDVCRVSVQPRQDKEAEEQAALQCFDTRLLVVADGAESTLRQQLGIQQRTINYEQSAIIANLSFARPHQGRAYERFTDEGPVAFLPLPDSEQGLPRAALVWSMQPEEAERRSNLTDKLFLEELQAAFGHRQGELLAVGKRQSYPLKRIQAEEQVRQRIVVMGNAAHSLHPVAGQGFNLSLRDCIRLTDLVCGKELLCGNNEADIGSLALLQQYLNQQRQDQQMISAFSHHLPALFTQARWPLQLARQLGLVTLDILPGAKQQFTAQTAGMFAGAAGANL